MSAPTSQRLVAGLLSVVLPGAGQLYLGARRRGLVLLAASAALLAGLLALASWGAGGVPTIERERLRRGGAARDGVRPRRRPARTRTGASSLRVAGEVEPACEGVSKVLTTYSRAGMTTPETSLQKYDDRPLA